MRISLSFVLLFTASVAFAPGVAHAQTVTATATVQAPANSKCPLADRGKTKQFTGQGCTKGACTSARQSAVAQLKGEVDKSCDNFVKANKTCVKHNC